ncbi:hypothetical protein GCM10009861_02830 [Neomicrococcus aestuarii]
MTLREEAAKEVHVSKGGPRIQEVPRTWDGVEASLIESRVGFDSRALGVKYEWEEQGHQCHVPPFLQSPESG